MKWINMRPKKEFFIWSHALPIAWGKASITSVLSCFFQDFWIQQTHFLFTDFFVVAVVKRVFACYTSFLFLFLILKSHRITNERQQTSFACFSDYFPVDKVYIFIFGNAPWIPLASISRWSMQCPLPFFNMVHTLLSKALYTFPRTSLPSLWI